MILGHRVLGVYRDLIMEGMKTILGYESWLKDMTGSN